MQSATSFFNRTLFRKDLQRFWPLWLGYTLIWLLLVPLPLLNELTEARSTPEPGEVSYSLLRMGAYDGLAMAVIFSIFFAMAMFAYLTNSRATQAFHTMPVRREALYMTNYLTGLFCMLSSLVLTFALAGITAACFGVLEPGALGIALLAACLSVLFFYSFAVFCMMFTGQLLAAPVFYGILNVLAAWLEFLVRTFAGNFLYGYSGYATPETFRFLSPLFALATTLDVDKNVETIWEDGAVPRIVHGDESVLTGLGLLGIYAAVGLVLALLGLLIYRRRASEASSSIVTVSWARPVFKYGVAVCTALSLGQLIYLLVFGIRLSSGEYSLAGTIACMLFTGLFGYFAAEMLLQKSFRVWRASRVGALVFSVVLVCFGVGMSLDLTGYESYVPDAGEIQSVSVSLSSSGDYFSCTLNGPEDSAYVLAAHRALIADKERQLRCWSMSSEAATDGSAAADTYLYFTLDYTLTDGRVVHRSYDNCRAFADELGEAGSVAQTMTDLLNSPAVSRNRALNNLADTPDAYLTGGYYDVISDGVYNGSNSGDLTAAQAELLRAALQRDYEAGNTSRASLFEDTRYGSPFRVELSLWYTTRQDDPPANRQPSTASDAYVIVTPDMTETLAVLAGMGVEFSAAAPTETAAVY